ncbi:sensor histidine kinase [Paenibacillus agaridevorans]|uniref:sensor histidine kinase n=1 Tax=Paenibacillus agaridevorans TaxID=171404 RepID=UPI001BE3D832|nr:histidine kinase [Paenibacillus agaridevorans]
MKTAIMQWWSYIRQYKFNSILWRNFILIMTLIIVPMVIISLIVYTHNDKDMRVEIEKSSFHELARIRDSFDMILFDVEQLSVRLKSDPDVIQLQSSKLSEPLKYDEAVLILRIQQVLQMVKLTSSYIDSIFIHSGFHDYQVTADAGGGLSNDYYHSWRNDQINRDQPYYWMTDQAASGDKTLLTFINKMSPGVEAQNGVGSIRINMNVQSLKALLGPTDQQQNVIILDEQNRIMFGRDTSKLNEKLEEADPALYRLVAEGFNSRIVKQDGREQVVSVQPSRSIKNWKYVSLVPLEAYHAERTRIIELMVVVLTVSAISSIVLAFIIAARGYRPIRQILSLIEHKDNPFMMLNKDSATTSWNETGYILSNISNSFHQGQNFEVKLKEKYELLRKAQAIALQAQINPHFLFNTLETINWKVVRLTGRNNEATQMLLSLSTLLRLTLETKEDLVPIRKEIEHVRLYMEMQMIRYKDRFIFDCQVEDRLLECRIVKLTLQPIVENAIYYGIKHSPHKGIIRIRIFTREGVIVVRILDNGIGIPSLAVMQLNESFRRDHLQENEHIGLRNVNQRIRLAFGEQYGLTVRSRAKAGTIVEMTIPLLQAGANPVQG